MTDAQLKKKYKELVRKTAKALEIFGEAALKSGAVEMSDWDDDFILPKVILTAGLQNIYSEWRPLNDKDRKEVGNVHLMTCADYTKID